MKRTLRHDVRRAGWSPKTKGRAIGTTLFGIQCPGDSALASFEPSLGLVDHIDPALAAHDAAIAVALLERTEGVAYLHKVSPVCRGARIAPWIPVMPRQFRAVNSMVDDTGIEPVTPSMSTKCSTAELIVHARCEPHAL